MTGAAVAGRSPGGGTPAGRLGFTRRPTSGRRGVSSDRQSGAVSATLGADVPEILLAILADALGAALLALLVAGVKRAMGVARA
jgi:hypothetical protein